VDQWECRRRCTKPCFVQGKEILSIRLGSPAPLIHNLQIYRVIESRGQRSLIFSTS